MHGLWLSGVGRLGHGRRKVSSSHLPCLPTWYQYLGHGLLTHSTFSSFTKILTLDNQADCYSNGVSEIIVGKALKKYNIPRQRVVIKTKLYTGVDDEGGQTPIHLAQNNDGPWVNRVGLSRKKIMDAVDESVKRLGTYIDVLYIHRLDRQTPREEIMRALNDVVESGKVRYIGASSVHLTLIVLSDRSLSNVHRCEHGNSRPCKTSLSETTGINLSSCKATTVSLAVRKSVR